MPAEDIKVFTAIAFLITIGISQPRVPQMSGRVFLIEKGDTAVWSACKSKSEWQRAIAAGSTTTFATVQLLSGHVVNVVLTTDDDPGAGDWIVEDQYSFDRSEKVVAVHRLVNVLPGDYSREQWFRIAGDSLVQTKQKNRRLSSRLVTTAEAPWLPDVKLVTRVSEFAFAKTLSQLIDGHAKRSGCT